MCNLILLTGSGFTLNFGGYSDWDIREAIKNQLTDKKLIERINKDPYEQIYQELNFDDNGCPDVIRQQFNENIKNAYEAMDSVITKKIEKLNIDEKGILQAFFKKFNYVFTLNQDLFLERCFGYHSFLTNRFSDDFQPIDPFFDLSNGEFGHPNLVRSEMENLLTEPEYQSVFKYFKLHGSYNWHDKDYSNVHIMGVGFEKGFKIRDYLLLHNYHSFFNEKLTKEKTMLVVIGYGFGDMHINNDIHWGVNAGLRLIVIDKGERDDFNKRLKDGFQRTYLYDNIQIPSREDLKTQTSEQSDKVISAIDEYYSLEDQSIFDILKSF